MQDDDDKPVWLEEEDDYKPPKHEFTVVMAVMAMLMFIGTGLIYRFLAPWLFNTHTTSGTIAAVLVIVLGWVPAYLLYFKVLQPLFKELYSDEES